MSNKNPNASYRELPQGLAFIISQMMKEVHTAVPGVVVSYDAETRRASVQPGLDLVMTDGSTIPRAILTDVPVLSSAGSGVHVQLSLVPGDTVWLMFSERGMERFKRNFEQGEPDDSIHAEKDAVAMPGFGPLAVTPASTDGLSVQTTDATEAVIVEPTGITIRSAGGLTIEGDVRITGEVTAEGQVTAESGVAVDGDLTQGGTDVGSGHRHGMVQPGMGMSGGVT